jgi:hypothetical protein
MHRHAFPRDGRSYWDPSHFIAARQKLAGNGAPAHVPMNTFPPIPPPAYAGPLEITPIVRSPNVQRRVPFKVDRFSDLRNETN